MIKKSMGLGLLLLGSWAWIAQGADVAPNFELWNNTDEPVYYFFGGSSAMETIPLNVFKSVERFGMTKLMPGEYTSPQSSQAMVRLSGYNKMLMLSIGDVPGPNTTVLLVEFLPSAYKDEDNPKKVYLELSKDGTRYSITPQEGTAKSLWMKTERGYSRSNLIQEKDYNFVSKNKKLGFVPKIHENR